MTLWRALRLLGIGRAQVEVVPADDQGAMRADALRLDGPAIVCAQAGNVNSGAFDPLAEIVAAAREHGAWVHVDGAFGLWAAASPALAHLSPARPTPTRGRPTATSGSTFPTTAASSPCATARRTSPRWACAPPTSCATTPRAPIPTGCPRPRDAAAASPSTRRCGRWAGPAWRSSWSATAHSHGTSQTGSAARSKCSTTSCSTRCCSPWTRTLIAARPGGGDVLGRRHGLARPPGDALLGLELGDHRGRHRPQRRGHLRAARARRLDPRWRRRRQRRSASSVMIAS